MAKNIPKPQPSSLNLGDIIYVLFKHKWKIILTTLVACAGAAVYYLRVGPTYESQAKLLVRYLVEESLVDDIDSKITPSGGKVTDSVIKSEVEILTSWDLAVEVAYEVTGNPREEKAKTSAREQAASRNPAEPGNDSKVVGTGGTNESAGKETAGKATPGKEKVDEETAKKEPTAQEARDELAAAEAAALKTRRITFAQLVPKSLWPDNPDVHKLASAAAAVITQGLTVGAEKGSSVITVSFRHSDQSVPQRVLDTLVQLYLKKHIAIHRYKETGEDVTATKTASSTELTTAENRLRELKLQHHVLSLPDALAGINAEMSRVNSELGAARAEFAEQEARVKLIEGLPPAENQENSGTGQARESEVPKVENPESGTATEPAPDRRVVTKYLTLVNRLSSLRSTDVSQSIKFAPGSAMVKSTENQIAALEKERLDMEKEFPYLVASNNSVAGNKTTIDPLMEKSRLLEIQAKLKVLEDALVAAKATATAYTEFAPQVARAERDLEIAETAYKYVNTKLKKSSFDGVVDEKNIPNIIKVQEATPGAINIKQRNQVVLGMVAGGPILSIGLVLLFGLFLNRTIKRPLELEEGMDLPLMLSIPYFSRRSRLKARRPMGMSRTTKLLKDAEADKAPWDQYHFIHPFAEALRDRLTNYFEANGNVRKPKLIGVTGYSVGAGTSTVASGLAASLSEIGDGKVLLVDMSGNQGAAHPFFDGRPALSLTKALRLPPAGAGKPEPDSGGGNNLFVARADHLSAGAATVGLRRMMPELKASDFDYIVFDMPPLGQTKPTATMAGFMDKVLVLVEAESNSRSEVRRGYRDLKDAGADVSMVFNKARSHGPRALVGDFS